jgi:site-specific DNA recombinase
VVYRALNARPWFTFCGYHCSVTDVPGTAVLYTRVSSKDQEEGFSLAAQRELLEVYAKDNGFRVAARFEESETAKAAGTRPAFGKMVEFLEEKGRGSVLLVEKTDRLYRNLKDWITLDDLKVEIHFVKEGSVISPASHSSQKFLHGIKVLMAKNYVENLSEEIRKGMTKKAKEGAFPSVAPIGYVNVPDKSIGIALDPKQAGLVRELFERATTGHQSAQELTRWARTHGLRSRKGAVLAKNTICTNILRNPAYTGSFRWGGKVYEGKYEPLISKTTFDRVQRALDGRSRAKGHVHQFTYACLVKCGTCGGLMSGDLKKGRYVYYRCAGRKGCKRFYPEKLLEAETLRLLSSLQIDEAVSEWLLAELEKLHDQGVDDATVKRLVSRRKALQRLQAQAYEDKLLGKIDEAFWGERNAAWQEELADIDGALLAIESAPSKADLLAAARKPVELLQAAPTLYVTQDSTEKAKLLRTMVSNYTITAGSVSVVLRSPFDVLARGARTGEWWS